jgi:hypothetical protein
MMKHLSETNLEAAVMVSQKSSEWDEMRRFRITGKYLTIIIFNKINNMILKVQPVILFIHCDEPSG